MKTLAFALASIAAAFTLALPARASDCENAGSMDAVRACLQDNLEQELDAAYRPVHANLSRKNPEAAKLLRKSQDTWAKFVDDSCAFTARMSARDMIEDDARHNCRADFIAARIKVLKSWAVRYK